jgi:hypothetical protein
MKIVIENKVLEFENKASYINSLFKEVQKILDEEGLEFSHLVIDGEIVQENYEDYLKNNIEKVGEIIVAVHALKDLIQDTLVSSFEYVNGALVALKALSEQFYQSPKEETWKQLADFFEGVQWLIDTSSRIDNVKNLNKILNYSVWNNYLAEIKSFDPLMQELEQAMINQDHVLIGDLLLYEIIPEVEIIREKLCFLLPSGGQYVS